MPGAFLCDMEQGWGKYKGETVNSLRYLHQKTADLMIRQYALFIILFPGSTVICFGQDSTAFCPKLGFRFAVEKGVTNNASLAAMQQILQPLNVNTKNAAGFVLNTIFAVVFDYQKGYGEIRYVNTRTSSENYQEVVGNPVSRAKFYGYGVGFTAIRELIDTRRFIVGPTVGYDLMWYRLDLLPVNYQNVPINNVVQNQAAYTPTTLKDTGFNLHLAVDAEVRFRVIREYGIGTRFGYQLPLSRSKQWQLNDGNISDLPTFRASMFFLQIHMTCMFSK